MSISIIAASVIATSTCSWDNPGANRYTGNVPAAVHHYTDIPVDIRNRLQSRMEKHQYDEIVTITGAGIVGNEIYADLRDMHFGENKLCRNVSQKNWSYRAKERGLVYCEEKHCIIVPTVCGNVSRVTKIVPVDVPEKKKLISKGVIPDDVIPEVPTEPQEKSLEPTVNTVPEPSSFLLALMAICAGMFVRKKNS